jgi:hypothetical protein
MKSCPTARASVAVFVSAAFLWMLVLGSSPRLHAHVHSEANRIEHTCAVTFVTSGSYSYSGHAPLLSAPVPAARFSKIPALHRFWVQPLFLSARIFEHAPPARG